jgi:Xaa-Pro dipeptidase
MDSVSAPVFWLLCGRRLATADLKVTMRLASSYTISVVTKSAVVHMLAVKKTDLNVAEIQKALQEEGLDGWLFYEFHGSDPLARAVLGLSDSHFVSRRWFYFVPVKGEPIKLVHRIEMEALDCLPGKKFVYLGWRELAERLREMLHGVKSIAMQYSPENAIPYVSRVDGGTLELVRSCGPEIKSSANLIQLFEATWSAAQLQSHLRAVELLRSIVFDAFAEIAAQLKSNNPVNEYQIQQFICRRFEQEGMRTNSPPIVAVNEHSGSPHYQPTAEHHSPIKKGDFVLLDIWAKLKLPHDAVYADITWTGYVGESVPEKYTKIFDIVSGARDAAVSYVREGVAARKTMFGWQVDDVTRKFITDRGYSEYFVHRTGHSIGVEVHGNGANIDNLETRDERRLMANTGFSIEPGIYLPEFGIRSEIDVYVSESEVIVGGQPIQTEIVPILALKSK